MKRYVNLLPKEEQKDFVLDKISTKILNLFIWVALSLVIMVIMLFATRSYLQSQFSQVTDDILTQRQVVSGKEVVELKKQLQIFNGHLQNLVTLDSNQALWSEVMIEFASLVPKNIAVDSMSVDRESGKIRITGFALSRDSVLELRENIIDSLFFTDINFPLSNLVTPIDVDFRYTFYVDPKYLIKSSPSI